MILKVHHSHCRWQRSGIGSDSVDCTADNATEKVTLNETFVCVCACVCISYTRALWPYNQLLVMKVLLQTSSEERVELEVCS